MASIAKFFVLEPPDDLKCLICLEVAEEPWQHDKCGRLFCNKCLKEYGKDKPCPNCRTEDPQYFQDNRSYREIQLLEVECSNKKRDCKWKGAVGTLKDHLTTCNFALLPCSKKCKDAAGILKQFMRKDLEKHLAKDCPNRAYICAYCKKKGTYASIQIHDETCAKKIIPCKNVGCSKRIQRQDLNQHILLECDHTMVECKYKSIGCETVSKRREITAHEQNNQLHLKVAIDTIAFLKKEWVKRTSNLTFRITGYQRKKESDIAIDSPSFYTSTNGYHMHIRIDCNGYRDAKGTHLSLYAYLLNGEHDAQLNRPFTGSVKYELLNQNQDDCHVEGTITVTSAKIGTGCGLDKAISFSKLSPDQPYLKNDTLYFRVSVEVANCKPWLECMTMS